MVVTKSKAWEREFPIESYVTHPRNISWVKDALVIQGLVEAQASIIIERAVKEGRVIKQGDMLYPLDGYSDLQHSDLQHQEIELQNHMKFTSIAKYDKYQVIPGTNQLVSYSDPYDVLYMVDWIELMDKGHLQPLCSMCMFNTLATGNKIGICPQCAMVIDTLPGGLTSETIREVIREERVDKDVDKITNSDVEFIHNLIKEVDRGRDLYDQTKDPYGR